MLCAFNYSLCPALFKVDTLVGQGKYVNLRNVITGLKILDHSSAKLL
jgi:hypothetical protein